MDLGLKDRVAIVTGSSQGIGKAIAFGLAKEGAKVIICARNIEKVRQTYQGITDATGSDVLPVRVDLRKKDDITSMVKATVEMYGKIDILVNNTGGPPSRRFVETTEENWRSAIDSLLMSAVNCSREVIPYMKQNTWGRIINMTSFAAKQPAERLILSNTLRAGIFGLTKTLSNELAEHQILVNAVCPGWTQTQRLEELAKVQAEISGDTYETVMYEWSQKIPLKRLARPEEIAHLVVFLSSNKASYITGAVIQVDGGFIKSLT